VGLVTLGSAALAPGLSTSACFGSSGSISTAYVQPSVTAFSVAGWVKTTNYSAVLFQTRGPAFVGQKGFSLTLSGYGGSSGVPQFQMDTDYIIVGVGSSASIADGKTHFLVGTWSGVSGSSAVASQFTLYVDGVAVTPSAKIAGSATAPFASNQPAVIGFHPAWGLNSANSCMSDIAVWHRALTAPEVTAMYASGNGS
jgi:hypothetical protein